MSDQTNAQQGNGISVADLQAAINASVEKTIEEKMKAQIPAVVTAVMAAINANGQQPAASSAAPVPVIQLEQDPGIIAKLMSPGSWPLSAKIAGGVTATTIVAAAGYFGYKKFFADDDE